MNSNHSPFSRIRSILPWIGLILLVSAMLLGVTLFMKHWWDIPIEDLTRDPNATGDLPFYTGFLSQIGIFFWSAAAAVCFFSFKIMLGTEHGQKLRNFLLISALGSLFLGLDDVFLLHEEALPYYVGVPEPVVFVSYAILGLIYLSIFYPVILGTEYILLMMAILFFGFSLAFDLIDLPFINHFLLEDGAKLIGLVSWFVYFFRTSEHAVLAINT